jgi:IS5 family transposase
MRPPPTQEKLQQDLFRHRLENIINMKHELVTLALSIDWAKMEVYFEEFYAEKGRPGVPTRMMVGLHILKHIFALSDESVCDRWVENPYFIMTPRIWTGS